MTENLIEIFGVSLRKNICIYCKGCFTLSVMSYLHNQCETMMKIIGKSGKWDKEIEAKHLVQRRALMVILTSLLKFMKPRHCNCLKAKENLAASG